MTTTVAHYDDGSMSVYHHGTLMMDHGQPLRHWHFTIAAVQRYITTLEEAKAQANAHGQKQALDSLICLFECILDKHVQEHHEFISQAQPGDLQKYLFLYAQAVKGELA